MSDQPYKRPGPKIRKRIRDGTYVPDKAKDFNSWQFAQNIENELEEVPAPPLPTTPVPTAPAAPADPAVADPAVADPALADPALADPAVADQPPTDQAAADRKPTKPSKNMRHKIKTKGYIPNPQTELRAWQYYHRVVVQQSASASANTSAQASAQASAHTSPRASAFASAQASPDASVPALPRASVDVLPTASPDELVSLPASPFLGKAVTSPSKSVMIGCSPLLLPTVPDDRAKTPSPPSLSQTLPLRSPSEKFSSPERPKESSSQPLTVPDDRAKTPSPPSISQTLPLRSPSEQFPSPERREESLRQPLSLPGHSDGPIKPIYIGSSPTPLPIPHTSTLNAPAEEPPANIGIDMTCDILELLPNDSVDLQRFVDMWYTLTDHGESTSRLRYMIRCAVVHALRAVFPHRTHRHERFSPMSSSFKYIDLAGRDAWISVGSLFSMGPGEYYDENVFSRLAKLKVMGAGSTYIPPQNFLYNFVLSRDHPGYGLYAVEDQHGQPMNPVTTYCVDTQIHVSDDYNLTLQTTEMVPADSGGNHWVHVQFRFDDPEIVVVRIHDSLPSLIGDGDGRERFIDVLEEAAARLYTLIGEHQHTLPGFDYDFAPAPRQTTGPDCGPLSNYCTWQSLLGAPVDPSVDGAAARQADVTALYDARDETFGGPDPGPGPASSAGPDHDGPRDHGHAHAHSQDPGSGPGHADGKSLEHDHDHAHGHNHGHGPKHTSGSASYDPHRTPMTEAEIAALPVACQEPARRGHWVQTPCGIIYIQEGGYLCGSCGLFNKDLAHINQHRYKVHKVKKATTMACLECDESLSHTMLARHTRSEHTAVYVLHPHVEHCVDCDWLGPLTRGRNTLKEHKKTCKKTKPIDASTAGSAIICSHIDALGMQCTYRPWDLRPETLRDHQALMHPDGIDDVHDKYSFVLCPVCRESLRRSSIPNHYAKSHLKHKKINRRDLAATPALDNLELDRLLHEALVAPDDNTLTYGPLESRFEAALRQSYGAHVPRGVGGVTADFDRIISNLTDAGVLIPNGPGITYNRRVGSSVIPHAADYVGRVPTVAQADIDQVITHQRQMHHDVDVYIVVQRSSSGFSSHNAAARAITRPQQVFDAYWSAFGDGPMPTRLESQNLQDRPIHWPSLDRPLAYLTSCDPTPSRNLPFDLRKRRGLSVDHKFIKWLASSQHRPLRIMIIAERMDGISTNVDFPAAMIEAIPLARSISFCVMSDIRAMLAPSLSLCDPELEIAWTTAGMQTLADIFGSAALPAPTDPVVFAAAQIPIFMSLLGMHKALLRMSTDIEKTGRSVVDASKTAYNRNSTRKQLPVRTVIETFACAAVVDDLGTVCGRGPDDVVRQPSSVTNEISFVFLCSKHLVQGPPPVPAKFDVLQRQRRLLLQKRRESNSRRRASLAREKEEQTRIKEMEDEKKQKDEVEEQEKEEEEEEDDDFEEDEEEEEEDLEDDYDDSASVSSFIQTRSTSRKRKIDEESDDDVGDEKNRAESAGTGSSSRAGKRRSYGLEVEGAREQEQTRDVSSVKDDSRSVSRKRTVVEDTAPGSDDELAYTWAVGPAWGTSKRGRTRKRRSYGFK